MDDKAAQQLKVIVADDHPVYRKGLGDLLEEGLIISEVAQAKNGREVLALLAQRSYDIVFMDIRMPLMNGIETSRIIRSEHPATKIIVITSFDSLAYVLELHKIGVEGYLLKYADESDFHRAISMVMTGEHYYCKEMHNILHKELLRRDDGAFHFDELNERETELLKLICAETITEEIMDKLCIAENTLQRMKHSLFEKTGSKSIAGLIIYALSHGIIHVED